MPFRLPMLHEKLQECELSDYFSDAPINALHTHDKVKHDLIGNFFKPSALLAALNGKTGTELKTFWENKDDQRHQLIEIKPVTLRELDDHYFFLRLAVLQSLSAALTAGTISQTNHAKALTAIRQTWRPEKLALPDEDKLRQLLAANRSPVRPRILPSRDFLHEDIPVINMLFNPPPPPIPH